MGCDASDGRQRLRTSARGECSRLQGRRNRSRAPKCARREDDAKRPSHTKRVKRPDEEEGSSGPFDANSRSCHMDDGHPRSEERPEEDNDQTRPAIAQQQCPAQIDDEDGDAN